MEGGIYTSENDDTHRPGEVPLNQELKKKKGVEKKDQSLKKQQKTGEEGSKLAKLDEKQSQVSGQASINKK